MTDKEFVENRIYHLENLESDKANKVAELEIDYLTISQKLESEGKKPKTETLAQQQKTFEGLKQMKQVLANIRKVKEDIKSGKLVI